MSQEDDADALSKLKRKIIAVDKLVKHKTKTEEKVKELTASLASKDSQLEEKNQEISKLKSELCQSLLSSDAPTAVDVSGLENKIAPLQTKTFRLLNFKYSLSK